MREREVVVDGRVVVVRVRESRRARTIRLTIGPGRPPEVVVPARIRSRTVDEFLRSNQRWLADKLATLRAASERPRVLPQRRGSVWLAGQPVPVIHDPGGRASATLSDGRLVVSGAHTHAPAAIERWYRREARLRLGRTAQQEAKRLGVRFRALSVRDQRTRWGSCSHNGSLSFSWRLVLAPAAVLDYVVVHELCHLREFNHSRSFWRLVESIRPDWRDAAGWLREHGYELHEYRPETGMDAAPDLTENETEERAT